MHYTSLKAIFHIRKPSRVIGATEKSASVAASRHHPPAIFWTQPFGATVFPVEPQLRTNVLGVRCYPNIASIGETVDLAVIVTPAETVAGVLQQCAEAGVKGAIVISAGFAERGAEGLEREKRLEICAGRVGILE